MTQLSREHDRVQALLEYVRQHGRVCPKPILWNKLHMLLPTSAPPGVRRPGVPLILGAWHFTSEDDKRERLADHIRFAAATDCFDTIDAFLRELSDGDWVCE
jgi:hypothetical protein